MARERRSKKEVLISNREKIEERIIEFQNKIVKLENEKKEIENAIAEIEELERKKKEMKELQEIHNLMQTKGLTIDDLRRIMEKKNTNE